MLGDGDSSTHNIVVERKPYGELDCIVKEIKPIFNDLSRPFGEVHSWFHAKCQRVLKWSDLGSLSQDNLCRT